MAFWINLHQAVLTFQLFLPLLAVDFVRQSNLLQDFDTNFQLSSLTNILTNSRRLDLVLVGPEHDEIFVRSYDASNGTYYVPHGYQYSFKSEFILDGGYKIAGVIPADFNGDKNTDVMVVFSKAGLPRDFKLVTVWNLEESFSTATTLNETFSDIPHLIDYDGDLFIDFICALDGKRYFFINDNNNPGTYRKHLIPDSDFEIDFAAIENAYAYGDLNGDCEADLFMMTKLKNGSSLVEFYESNQKELQKTWQTVIPEALSKYSAPIIADMDGNGKSDIVIAGCSDVSSGYCHTSRILIFYSEPCNPKSTDSCGVYRNSCEKYTFNAFTSMDLYVFDKFQHDKATYGFVDFDRSSDIYGSNYVLRAADYNSDGHIDLVGILQVDNQAQPVIFRNIDDPSAVGGRSFEIEWRDEFTVSSDEFSPYAIAPVDALGIGANQFFLVGRGKDDTTRFSLDFFQTVEPLDTFFLKVTVLCLGCDSESTTMIGANSFFFTKDYKGNPQVGYSSQGSQLTTSSLQPPYTLFGLGPQANYIQYLEVSYRNTRQADRTVDFFHFDQLIPNTQVFAKPLGDVWRLVMMVVPGETLWSTLIVLGVLCIISMIIILILHIKEKKEDEREKRKFNAKFNFDAM